MRWASPVPRNCRISRAGGSTAQKLQNCYAQERSTAQNCRILRAGAESTAQEFYAFPSVGTVHRPGIAFSHAREWSIARKMQNSTRRRGPPLGKCKISRAGAVHRSGIAESHARDWSTAQKLQNSTRRRGPPLKNRRILRAGAVHRSENEESHAREVSTAKIALSHARGRFIIFRISFLTFSKKIK